MSDDYYAMNRQTRKNISEWAKENGYGTPGPILKPLFVFLLCRYGLSLICEEIDATLDRLIFLQERMTTAIRNGNLMAVLFLKDQQDESKTRLAGYLRSLSAEAPVKKEKKQGEITDEMVLRAREYPFEDLLPEQLRRGRCRCPVHNGKNSMSFSVKENRGSCFSCGWKGDPIQFLMDTEGLSFPEAVRRLN